MADGFSVDLQGLADIDDKLVLLGQVSGQKAIRSALMSAAKPIQDQAVANISLIRRGSGALAKSVRRVFLGASATEGASSGSRFVVAIAPKTKDPTAIALANLYYKRRKPIRGIFWGHLEEWGFTHIGGTKVEGKHVFTNAIEARKAEAVTIFRQKIEENVERALNKQNPQ